MGGDGRNLTSVFDALGSQPGLRLRMANEAYRISSQHRQLGVFFEMVMSAMRRSSLHGARIAYLRFRDALEAHVTLEDQMFFPALSRLNPRFRVELADLVDEHEAFRVMLDELQDLLARGDGPGFQRAFERFAESFSEHEVREERIVKRASAKTS